MRYAMMNTHGIHNQVYHNARHTMRADTVGAVQEETEYLLTLCERFDLRFVVIADRYSWPPGGHPGRARAIEDLKARYYALAAALTVARAGERLLAANQPLVRTPYDAQRERERKEYLRMSFARTPQQVCASSLCCQVIMASLRKLP